MPYRYLEDIATADVAFEAWGISLEEMFGAAADAVMNLMVENISNIERVEKRMIETQDSDEDLLLFSVLQELVFLKDAYQLLGRLDNISIKRQNGNLVFRGEVNGETIDPKKHHLAVDVKAVTLHRLKVEKKTDGWYSTVVLDI